MKRGFQIVFLFFECFALCAHAQEKVKVPMDLVGKWCFYNIANGDEGRITNTCVTLNDDGTYEFTLDGAGLAQARSIFPGVSIQQTDYGDWWAEGNRLFYKSQAHGSGSFLLQKMNQPPDKTVPMIVLNGQAFVSTSSKDPW